MRKLDKEIWKAEANRQLGRAVALAKKAGYFTEVYDGDAENGMCAPVLVDANRRWPDIGEQFYGRNE